VCAACSEWRLKPTFPEEAAGKPVINEQALLGLSEQGDAAAVQLIDVEGAPPTLTLIVLDREGAPTRTLATAPGQAARNTAQRVRLAGRRPTPILAAAIASDWPEAVTLAAREGFSPRPSALPEPGRRRWPVTGVSQNGSLPFVLRLTDAPEDPSAQVLFFAESPAGDEAELARMPVVGTAMIPEVWIVGSTVWILSGSVLATEPLHRAVGLRRGSLTRGEAQLHNTHGLSDYAAGDLDAARREFERALAADPLYFDSLYNAASAFALSDRAPEAVEFLRRAAQVDPARVQVLGRNDEDLRSLRKREDVRAILGLVRLPPEDVPPPP
jgi:hypothetical protein